jgi:hypothetical protein
MCPLSRTKLLQITEVAEIPESECGLGGDSSHKAILVFPKKRSTSSRNLPILTVPALLQLLELFQ